MQHFQVVIESAHPGLHLFFLGARQEADVLADRHGGAGDDDLVVEFLVEHLLQARRQCQQGLAGTGLAQQGDEVDLRVHQQVEREVLLAVAGGHAPHIVLVVRVVLERLQQRGLAVDFLDLGVQR